MKAKPKSNTLVQLLIRLSCDSMVLSIIQKANARLKFLYRKRKYLTFSTKKLLVISLIQCHFDCACSFWFSCLSQNLKNRLQTTQNKLIRFVLNLDQMIHVGPEHFKFLNWLPVTKSWSNYSLPCVQNKVQYCSSLFEWIC